MLFVAEGDFKYSYWPISYHRRRSRWSAFYLVCPFSTSSGIGNMWPIRRNWASNAIEYSVILREPNMYVRQSLQSSNRKNHLLLLLLDLLGTNPDIRQRAKCHTHSKNHSLRKIEIWKCHCDVCNLYSPIKKLTEEPFYIEDVGLRFILVASCYLFYLFSIYLFFEILSLLVTSQVTLLTICFDV